MASESEDLGYGAEEDAEGARVEGLFFQKAPTYFLLYDIVKNNSHQGRNIVFLLVASF